MSVLSVFVDEASNFGPYERHNPFYVLTLVLHDQDGSIQEDVKKLDEALANTRHITGKAIHTGPLIRRNESYAHQSIDERRKQFFKLMVQKKMPEGALSVGSRLQEPHLSCFLRWSEFSTSGIHLQGDFMQAFWSSQVPFITMTSATFYS